MHPVSSFTTPVDDLYVGQGTQHGGNKSSHQSPVPNQGYVENPKPQSTPALHGQVHGELGEHTTQIHARCSFYCISFRRSLYYHFRVRSTILNRRPRSKKIP